MSIRFRFRFRVRAYVPTRGGKAGALGLVGVRASTWALGFRFRVRVRVR